MTTKFAYICKFRMEFDLKKFEKEAQKKWKKANAFKFNNDSKNSYYVLEQFPYPSGNIHMGHLRCYTIGDAIARFRRLQGHNVLHPFGFDAFGLPAENAAIDNGINPSAWTHENINKILADLDKLGMSIDENRIIVTCEPEYYKHEQKMFLDFVKNNIAYQKESIVNWDPVDHTVLANEQVIDGKGWRSGAPVERKKLKQWYLRITKYADDLLECLDKALPEWPNKVKTMQQNWIGKSYGAIIKFASPLGDIEVFSTRPDTLFGGSFIGLSPFHPLAKQIAETNKEVANFVSKCEQDQLKDVDAKENKEKKGVFTGINCKHPLTGKDMPLWIANFVLMDYGTGAVFGCPAHDERDKEFWDKYGIEYSPVINEYGKLINSDKFNGLTSEEAKEAITKELEKLSRGEAKVMYKLRDWCISRQRYWGCPIPMVYCDKCGCVPEKEENLPITLPEDVKFDGKGNPLDKHPTWKHCKCPMCEANATRETDTFDTFFESSWYFLRYLSPKDEKKPFNTKDIKNIMPVQDYIGGIEHAILHLLYSRFFTKALADCDYLSKTDLPNLEPFRRLITQGMVLHEAFKNKDGKWVEACKVTKKDKKCFIDLSNN